MAAKGSVKRVKAAVQTDTNVGAMTMGNGWTPRALRRGAGSRSASGGRASRKASIPPATGWVSGPGGNC